MYSNGNVKPHPKEWSLFYQNTTKEQTKFLSKVFFYTTQNTACKTISRKNIRIKK